MQLTSYLLTVGVMALQAAAAPAGPVVGGPVNPGGLEPPQPTSTETQQLGAAQSSLMSETSAQAKLPEETDSFTASGYPMASGTSGESTSHNMGTTPHSSSVIETLMSSIVPTPSADPKASIRERLQSLEPIELRAPSIRPPVTSTVSAVQTPTIVNSSGVPLPTNSHPPGQNTSQNRQLYSLRVLGKGKPWHDRAILPIKEKGADRHYLAIAVGTPPGKSARTIYTWRNFDMEVTGKAQQRVSRLLERSLRSDVAEISYLGFDKSMGKISNHTKNSAWLVTKKDFSNYTVPNNVTVSESTHDIRIDNENNWYACKASPDDRKREIHSEGTSKLTNTYRVYWVPRNTPPLPVEYKCSKIGIRFYFRDMRTHIGEYVDPYQHANQGAVATPASTRTVYPSNSASAVASLPPANNQKDTLPPPASMSTKYPAPPADTTSFTTPKHPVSSASAMTKDFSVSSATGYPTASMMTASSPVASTSAMAVYPDLIRVILKNPSNTASIMTSSTPTSTSAVYPDLNGAGGFM